MSNSWKVDLWTNSDALKNSKRTKTTGIMVHSTATPGVMAQDFRDRWNKPDLGKSVHFFVDDQEAIQCMPLELKAGHCGRGTSGKTANDTHLSFEMCEPTNWKTDAEYFNKVYERAVNLTVELCKMYGLTESNVLSHAEGYKAGIASNHADVGHWFPLFSKSMDDFRSDVKKKLGEASDTSDAPSVYTFTITRNLKNGDSGDDVKSVQIALENAGYKGSMNSALYGSFGSATETAVKSFQKAKGLTVDGIVGVNTATALGGKFVSYTFTITRNLKNGDSGDDVKSVQIALENAGYKGSMNSALYGSFGDATEQSVKNFQKAKGLTVDGIVGVNTATALGGKFV